MGADLILSIVIFEGDYPSNGIGSWSLRQEKMDEYINKIDEEHLIRYKDEWVEFFDKVGETENLEDCKRLVKEIISNFGSTLNCRDIVDVEIISNLHLIITGGMSWGSAASESEPVFEDFCSIPGCILDAGNISIGYPKQVWNLFMKKYGSYLNEEETKTLERIKGYDEFQKEL